MRLTWALALTCADGLPACHCNPEPKAKGLVLPLAVEISAAWVYNTEGETALAIAQLAWEEDKIYGEDHNPIG